MGSKETTRNKHIQRRMNKRAKALRKRKAEYHAVLLAALVALLLHTSVDVTIPAFDIGPVTVGPIQVHVPGSGK